MTILNVTTSNSRAALGTVQGARVLLVNYGPSGVYALLGGSSVSAAGPTGTYIAPGISAELGASGADDHIAAITVSGTAALDFESPSLGPAGPFVGPTGPSGGPTGPTGPTGP